MFGGLATYGLCRKLQIAHAPSALVTASYLFNPLIFVPAYTFMSDPYFTELLVTATYGYDRGRRTDRKTAHNAAMVFGSLATACAFLVRQQETLIPAAIMIVLLAQRRVIRDRAGLLLALRVAALPALAFAGYYLWLGWCTRFHGSNVPLRRTSSRPAGSRPCS